MQINFDKKDVLEMPSIVLCNPNGKELEAIDGTIYNTEFTLRCNSMSEFSFTVPSKMESGELNVWYNLVRAKRLVKVENIGVFQIYEATKTNDGVQDVKEIMAFSLEVDLNYKKVNLLSGIYKFCDPLDYTNENTLIGKIMSMPQMRGWKIGTISTSLHDKTRSYEVSDQTIYNFFMTTVEEAMECIFKYDTFTKTIHILDMTDAITQTDIFLSYENLLKSVTVEEMSDELVTAMHCYGGGDLTIRGVNPLGDVVIYNFDYFLKEEEEWLDDGLRQSIINWQNVQEANQQTYADLLVQYKAKNSEFITAKGELADMKSIYNAIEGNLSIEMDAGGNTTDLATQLENQEQLIKVKQASVDAIELEVKAIQDSLTAIQTATSIESNFTEEQLEELSCYMVEATYVNDAFIQTTTMNAVQIQDMQQELYDFSKKVLSKLSQPRYSFSIESTNFLFLKEFERFTRQLELGCEICIDMDDGLFSYPVLLEMTFSYDDPTSFTMTFGNRMRLDKNDFRFAELFGESVNAGSSVTINQGNWSEFKNNYQNEVSNFINNELVAAQKNIVNAANQQIKIGEWGMLAQKMLDNGDYSPKKAWWINNGLYFTKDNFKTVSAAFGEFENGGYGVLADVIGGKLLIGNQLMIEATKEDGTGVFFRVDENGVYMKNADIIMESGESLDAELGNVISQNTSTSDKLNNVLTSSGELDTNKLQGQILGAKNSFLCVDGDKALIMNALGLMIANSKLSNGEWAWKTAISADGIIAESIKSGGTIQGCALKVGESSTKYLEIRTDGVISGIIDGEETFFISHNSQGVLGLYSPEDNTRLRVTSAYNWNMGSGGRQYQGCGIVSTGGDGVALSGDFFILGDYTATGAKNAIVPTENYGDRLLYSEESDKVYFNTYGKAETKDGEITIEIDKIFLETIEKNSECPYIVTVTPYGNSSIWVEKCTDDSITVKSDKDVKFDYNIKCIRKGYKDVCLLEKKPKTEEEREYERRNNDSVI